jgi:hypothetical protein
MAITDEAYAKAIEATRSKTVTIQPAITEQNLKEEIMAVPLSAVADMWTARFRDSWVDQEVIAEDKFWRIATIRLLATAHLEKHELANSFKVVYRIIE